MTLICDKVERGHLNCVVVLNQVTGVKQCNAVSEGVTD